MMFCSNGSHVSDVWVANGIGRCFYDTMSSVLTLCAVVVWTVALCVQHRAGQKKEEDEPSTEAAATGCGTYSAQCVFTCVLAVEALVHMVLQDLYLQVEGLCGVHVLTTSLLVPSYLFSLILLRHQRMTSAPCAGSDVASRGLGPVVFWAVTLTLQAMAAVSWSSPQWWGGMESKQDKVELAFWVTRVTCCLCLLSLSIGAKVRVKAAGHKDFDAVSLEAVDAKSQNGGSASKRKAKELKKKAESRSVWSDAGRQVRVMAPLLWPRDSPVLQAVVLTCVLLLVAERVVNIYVPLYSKKIVNSLTEGEGSPSLFPWQQILVYCALLYMKGAGSGGGLLQHLRQQLWVKVQQASSVKMNVKIFTHIHNLSLRWHLQRKTGEVLRIVDRGTTSMNTVLNQALFQIIPTLVDCLIAVVYFITAFSYLFGLIVFTCVIIYIVLTYHLMEWRTKFKREMKNRDKETQATAVDSLLNFETVKYYGATEFEINNYRNAILGFQVAEWRSQSFVTWWQCTQNLVTVFGYLGVMMLCAWTIVHHDIAAHLTVGDLVLLLSYLGQLFGPLNSLGEYYRALQKSLLDMENMFELLEIEEDVKDAPDAKELDIQQGEIEFRNVSFCYEPSRSILKDVSFTVSPGKTLALVGHTGSGKSTIVRLLFRFYDVCDGAIYIDGQDIAKVTQTSLRNSIGVVPQDTVLFNRDIRYNIQYGRFNAGTEDVEAAAVAAQIHHRILKFPSQYGTLVGERGLKLSGGEKQRVAIARTLLKAPAIVLLDEATSALDTKTERDIQSALETMCQNRTTIVIAHRLSTIVNADVILVLQEGEVVERGRHEELLALNGYYAEMWSQQSARKDRDSASVSLTSSPWPSSDTLDGLDSC